MAVLIVGVVLTPSQRPSPLNCGLGQSVWLHVGLNVVIARKSEKVKGFIIVSASVSLFFFIECKLSYACNTVLLFLSCIIFMAGILCL